VLAGPTTRFVNIVLTSSAYFGVMAEIEKELVQAIAYRNELAVELASSLLHLACEGGEGLQEKTVLISGRGDPGSGRYDQQAVDIEALTAVILNRAGASWDALAAAAQVSKQALHRRLSERGEKLYADAQAESQYREVDMGVLVESLEEAQRLEREAEQSGDWEALQEFFWTLPHHTRDMMIRLVWLKSTPTEILTAALPLADALLRLKKTSRQWWWDQ
jgi:hypothetical protein